jgi:Mn-dependent DtxR family transcriptional regulator
MEPFTKLQGQYLAFIVAYTKLNRCAPAEADFRQYFNVTPPSVHNMIVALERRRLITEQGASRAQSKSRFQAARFLSLIDVLTMNDPLENHR